LKNLRVNHGVTTARGEAVVTAYGVESGVFYAVGATLRDTIGRDGHALVVLDLHPDRSRSDVARLLATRRAGDSTRAWLRRRLGLAPVTIGLLREATGNRLPSDPAQMAALVKAAPLRLVGVQPLARAISTAGGVAFAAVDDSSMLLARPGVFVAGEMLDWDAPTGGYLLQACVSTGRAAAAGALRWLDR
jgi:predicted flavoprotein YhiN